MWPRERGFGEEMECTGGSDQLKLREKAVAMETEKAGIPMQPIPRHTKRARVLENCPEREG